MKIFRSFVSRSILSVLLIAATALVLSPPDLNAQVTQGTFAAPTYVEAAATSNVVTKAVAVRQNRGLAIMPEFKILSASTANLTFTFDVSRDGTNWSTTGPFVWVIAANGTTLVRGYTNLPPTALDNINWIRLTSVANAATNTATNFSVRFSYRDQ
jgi:hypothetical protein